MLFMFSDASHKSCFAHMGTTNAFPWRQIVGQNVKRWEKWNYGSPRIIYTYMILLFPRRFLQDLRQLLEGYATPVSRNGRLLLFSLWSVHEAIHEAILPLRNTLCSESWNNEKRTESLPLLTTFKGFISSILIDYLDKATESWSSQLQKEVSYIFRFF